jgi:hypothetical protein
MMAADNGDMDMVETLLKDNRLDVNKKDKDDYPPFFFALNSGVETLKLLLSNKRIDINQKRFIMDDQGNKESEQDIIEFLKENEDQINGETLKKSIELIETERKKRAQEEIKYDSKMNKKDLAKNLLTAAAEGKMDEVRKITTTLKKIK